jgi:beta-mannanase
MTGRRQVNRAIASILAAAVVAAVAILAASPAVAGNTNAAVALSPASGPIGTTVSVTGTTFPKKSNGTVTAGSATVPITTGASGYFTAVVTIPETTAASLPILATVGNTSAAATFTVTYSSPSATTTSTNPTASVPSSAAPISSARLRFGVSTPGGARANAELDAAAAAAGESPSIVLSYYDFAQPAPIADLDSVAARGATSLITWEPWLWGAGVTQAAYSNARVTAGDFDPYLRQWGTALANWGQPVLLRYAHEMNGNWYPWSDGMNNNAAGSYIAAWRHVHDVLQAQGASNISWVWSPNIPYTGSTSLASVYPGAAWVDVVALDGYNWGTATTWSSWTAPATLFGGGLSQLRTLAPEKPILIAETASAESGGSKASWNTDLIAYLAAQPDVIGFVWFDHNKEVDWRTTSSATSASAFAAALSARRT